MDFIQENERSVNIGRGERLLSLAGGTALLLYALNRRGSNGLLPGVAGGGLLYRGVTGHSILYDRLELNTAGAEQTGIVVSRAVTVTCSPEESYRFWRNLDNLPRFMQHLESVQTTDNGHSHWIAKAPVGITLEWDAHITEDRPNELIAWETLPESAVQHSGLVTFTPEARGWGTEVLVTLEYRPPGGIAGKAFAQLLNVVTAQQIEEEIRRFKHILEAGEIATTEGQPAGR